MGMSEIKRIYYTPQEAANELGITTRELGNHIKFLGIHKYPRATGKFVIHSRTLSNIREYQVINNEANELRKRLALLKRRLNNLKG